MNSLYSRQYHSIIFYHNEVQKELAVKSYEREILRDEGTVATEIVPFSAFYPAEDYHQKYYLQGKPELMKDFKAIYPSFKDFVSSTAAARINGYVGGYGEQEVLDREIDSYGLSDSGKERLLEIAGKGLIPGCPTP